MVSHFYLKFSVLKFFNISVINEYVFLAILYIKSNYSFQFFCLKYRIRLQCF